MSKRKIFIIILLLLVAGGIVTWTIYKRKIVKDGVAQTVANKTNNLYGIQTGKLDIDEVAGNLTVTNLQLNPDSNVYNHLVSINDAPSVLIQINIPSLTVEGVKTPKALLNSAIDGRKVIIHAPRIDLFFTGKGKDSLKTVPDKEVYRQILGNLELIKIDTLSVVNATLVTRDWKTGDIRMQFDSVSIDLLRIAVDSLHDKDTTRILFAEQAAVKCKKASWTSKNKLYHYEVRDIDLNSGAKQLSVHRFVMDPRMPEQKFLQQFKYANDRFDIDLQQVRVTNLNVPLLLREQVKADSLISGKSSIRIYRDLSYPHDKKSRVGTYPQQAVMKLPMEVDIGQALFHNSFIEYKERNGKSEKSGKVQFYNAGLRITNLTSYKQDMAQHPMRMQFNAQFLNKAPVKAVINFYPDNGKFTIAGEMGSMSAKGVNELTEPMGLAKIETGTITSLQFNFTGNDHAADGHLTVLYDDLKITLLKKDTVDNSLSKKKFASMLANIKVMNANPGKNGEVRRATVHYDRDETKSFFNLVWKSIFTGVKESVGIK
ncbi:hypothetical protein D3H65_01060 [Paraflavitalea soli]|uniref:DUF748 domain-containing protein n=1 Tax=Paraflavitalea soli TaxID=2315862 RepID=A0A3B7MHR7_9BACT|nr:hypothetical protein [Paraflavitalea soli]AXY72646.1 hypothetical protein D3H65_01060 [Paraflavitalea soli]